jgi:predicted NAD/FAD-binding protein
MRIAVVGAGISGLGAAWLLARRHEVVLYESDSRLGGHTDTHRVELEGTSHAIDSGFIVFNERNYPLLTRLFSELGVATQPTQMSFSVHNSGSGLQYNAGSLAGLFCQKRNLVSSRFWRMLLDLRRFYREAPTLLSSASPGPNLGDYLEERGYGAGFVHDHLVPMTSALWSAPARRVLEFPARHLVQFMHNHSMLRVDGRPTWRVVSGGSSSYVRAMLASWQVQVRLGQPVVGVVRTPEGVEVATPAGVDRFDQVVLACHSDQALAMLTEPTAAEREVLGAIRYQDNDVVLHTDARLLPPDRRAWAAWNAHVSATDPDQCTVSYCMNLLQSIRSPRPFVVTLNRGDAVAPEHVLARRRYQHPIFDRASVAAQAQRARIDGVDRIWFAGAYWGWGFHEDGLRSAVAVAARLGVAWPEPRS